MTLCIIFHVFSCLIPVIRHVYHKASVNENQIYIIQILDITILFILIIIIYIIKY